MALSRFFKKLFGGGEKKQTPVAKKPAGKELSQQELDKIAGAKGKEDGGAQIEGMDPPKPWPPR
jgi:hypothetical protein